jgi:uncharacterized membrane protein
MNTEVADRPATPETAKIIYILYLVGLVVGLTALVGLIMAYVNKDAAPDWLKTHYEFQIRTFWIGLLYTVISGLLCLVLIGFVLILLWYVWVIIRCVKGLSALERKEAPPDPRGWLF